MNSTRLAGFKCRPNHSKTVSLSSWDGDSSSPWDPGEGDAAPGICRCADRSNESSSTASSSPSSPVFIGRFIFSIISGAGEASESKHRVNIHHSQLTRFGGRWSETRAVGGLTGFSRFNWSTDAATLLELLPSESRSSSTPHFRQSGHARLAIYSHRVAVGGFSETYSGLLSMKLIKMQDANIVIVDCWSMITTRLLDIQFKCSTNTDNNSSIHLSLLLPSSLSDIFLCINTLNIDTLFHYVTNCFF